MSEQQSPANAAIGGNMYGLDKADDTKPLQNPSGTGQQKHSQHIDEASRVITQDDHPVTAGDASGQWSQKGHSDEHLKLEARTDQVPQKLSQSTVEAGGGEAGLQATALHHDHVGSKPEPAHIEGIMHPAPTAAGAGQTRPSMTPAGVVLKQNQPAHP